MGKQYIIYNLEDELRRSSSLAKAFASMKSVPGVKCSLCRFVILHSYHFWPSFRGQLGVLSRHKEAIISEISYSEAAGCLARRINIVKITCALVRSLIRAQYAPSGRTTANTTRAAPANCHNECARCR
ncbi:hypothetical protein EVAR_81635_1 [Eumeta japonica]|uniref:Uncharacterized protein n=1 Tax=Eumeta variegata TaxID=151549 RepID=A0A4C1WFZ8_EUMVA|nr:hypothetical protein EVAR_81635_1 [Eumeta japonica]